MHATLDLFRSVYKDQHRYAAENTLRIIIIKKKKVPQDAFHHGTFSLFYYIFIGF